MRTLYCNDNNSKKAKCNHHINLRQEIDSDQFIKFNEEGFNEDFHRWSVQISTQKNNPTNKTTYNHVDEIWFFELADFSDEKNSKNEGLRYMFAVIDNFSVYSWCVTLKNKNAETITNKFSKFLNTSKRALIKIESNRWAEICNNIFRNFLELKIIHHYSRFTGKDPSVAERLIWTSRVFF